MLMEKSQLRGLASRRQWRARKVFQLAVEQALGEQVRANGACAVELWSAITGVVWVGPEQAQVQHTARTAADLVAWVREDEDASVWYASAAPAVVAP